MFSIELLGDIRAWEIEYIASHFSAGACILEIGAGTGQQSLELSKRGFNVEAIDLPQSLYAQARVFPIKDYDGLKIPFCERSFDFVFSSNVLEHISDLPRIHTEIRRVLKTDGCAIHSLPTHRWRLWTTLSAFPAAIQSAGSLGRELWIRPPVRYVELCRLCSAWLRVGRGLAAPFRQPRHGERGNIFSEAWYFHPSWWRRNFEENGFAVERELPMGLFYTGNLVMGRKWDISKRTSLARFLGSACCLFVLRKVNGNDMVERPIQSIGGIIDNEPQPALTSGSISR